MCNCDKCVVNSYLINRIKSLENSNAILSSGENPNSENYKKLAQKRLESCEELIKQYSIVFEENEKLKKRVEHLERVNKTWETLSSETKSKIFEVINLLKSLNEKIN